MAEIQPKEKNTTETFVKGVQLLYTIWTISLIVPSHDVSVEKIGQSV